MSFHVLEVDAKKLYVVGGVYVLLHTEYILCL